MAEPRLVRSIKHRQEPAFEPLAIILWFHQGILQFAGLAKF
jgi:hypothetical protein